MSSLLQIFFLTMADMTAFSEIFLDLAKKVIELNQEACISVELGNEVTLQFDNRKIKHEVVRRKLSPSQIKRNDVRKEEYLMKKLKHEIGVVKEEVEKADNESQVEITVCNNETQMELQCISVGVNTENQKVNIQG